MKPKHLKRWRKKQAFTQIAAADALDVSRRTYQEMEHGETPIRGHIALACAAITAGINAEELER